LATIAGILPIALGFGEAGEARRPLGVVAVGGMVTSTLLTLIVIPVIYTLIAGKQKKRAEGAPAS
jgi:HAE1 family hydrophobic/amphiphilic exporter-1